MLTENWAMSLMRYSIARSVKDMFYLHKSNFTKPILNTLIKYSPSHLLWLQPIVMPWSKQMQVVIVLLHFYTNITCIWNAQSHTFSYMVFAFIIKCTCFISFSFFFIIFFNLLCPKVLCDELPFFYNLLRSRFSSTWICVKLTYSGFTAE